MHTVPAYRIRAFRPTEKIRWVAGCAIKAFPGKAIIRNQAQVLMQNMNGFGEPVSFHAFFHERTALFGKIHGPHICARFCMRKQADNAGSRAKIQQPLSPACTDEIGEQHSVMPIGKPLRITADHEPGTLQIFPYFRHTHILSFIRTFTFAIRTNTILVGNALLVNL